MPGNVNPAQGCSTSPRIQQHRRAKMNRRIITQLSTLTLTIQIQTHTTRPVTIDRERRIGAARTIIRATGTRSRHRTPHHSSADTLNPHCSSHSSSRRSESSPHEPHHHETA